MKDNRQKNSGVVKCPKRITNPNARTTMKAGHEQTNYKVISTDENEHAFTFFTCQNSREGMENDFSCGLNWNAPNGETLTLCRYNGSSHNHPNHLEDEVIGYEYHIHKATKKYIRANRKPEGYAEVTKKYFTLKGAIHCLVKDSNVSGIRTEADEPKLF